MAMDMDEPLVYSVPHAGRLLGLGRTASYEAVKRREIPVLKLGRKLVVPVAALTKMLESGRQPQ